MSPDHPSPTPHTLSREAYGEGLAEWLWDEFTRMVTGEGIHGHHRETRGIALMRMREGVGLYRVDEGRPWPEPLLAWRERDAFLSYWAAQSDYGLSGMDPDHPEIGGEQGPGANHQRINLRRIHEFLEQRQQARPRPGKQGLRWAERVSFSGLVQGEWKPPLDPQNITGS